MIHEEISDGIGFRQGRHASNLLGIRQVTDKNITDKVVAFEVDEAVTLEANKAVVVIVEVNEAIIVIVEVNEAVVVLVVLFVYRNEAVVVIVVFVYLVQRSIV
jgi:hypothetical protein